MLENILTQEEIEALSKQDRLPELISFDSFSGVDGYLYFEVGRTLSPEDYQAVGTMAFAAPAGIATKILAMAVEDRRIEGSNAYVIHYDLSIDHSFGLTQRGQGVKSSESFSIFSVVYIKADEEKLKRLKDWMIFYIESNKL